jgi:hypothetical protein
MHGTYPTYIAPLYTITQRTTDVCGTPPLSTQDAAAYRASDRSGQLHAMRDEMTCRQRRGRSSTLRLYFRAEQISDQVNQYGNMAR